MRKNWLLIAIGLLVAVLAIGAIACDDDDDDDGGVAPTATVEPGETPPSPTVLTITITEVDGSGITGTATITAADSDVEVVVEATGLGEGSTYVSGTYDSTSVNCSGGLLGSFSDSFSGADGRVIYTVADTSLADVFAISVRVTETGSPPGTVVACGEVES